MNIIKQFFPLQVSGKTSKHKHGFNSEASNNHKAETLPLTLAAKKPLSIRYVTTRKTSELPSAWFSSERENPFSIYYGEISLPANNAAREEGNEENSEEELHKNFTNQSAASENFMSQVTHKVLSESAYYKGIENLEGDSLVYIHGFNMDFTSAASRVMQFAHTTNFSGQIYLFSWPSQAKFIKYAEDKKSALDSSQFLASLLTDLLTNKKGRVHLLAHSMGSLALVTALQSLQENTGSHFENVIFVAPDLAAKRFTEKRWPQIKHLAKHWSVYFSNKDLALILSRIKNVESRLGASACPIDSLECIDVSSILFKRCSWSETHSYHEQRRRVGMDIVSLIKGLRPRQRALKQDTNHSETVWQFS